MGKVVMLFCPNCDLVDSIDEDYGIPLCSECKHDFVEMGCTKDEWESLDPKKQEEIKEIFRPHEDINRNPEEEKAIANVMITSGYNFEGYKIVKYSGYISGDDVTEVSRGVSVLGMGATHVGSALTEGLTKIRRRALRELKEAAFNLGCNAVIGVDFDYITLEPETASISGRTTYLPYVFCVTANGTAVKIKKE